jgi:hypothetical protein
LWQLDKDNTISIDSWIRKIPLVFCGIWMRIIPLVFCGSWIRIIPLVFCGSYNVPSLILKSLKEAFKQVWFFLKTLPTMVHGKTSHIITWQFLSRGPFYPPHGGNSLG